MKQKVIFLNVLSCLCFFCSSGSLLSVPFLHLEEAHPPIANLFAGMFWGGLLIGWILQIRIRKFGAERQPVKKANLFLILTAIFSAILIFLLVFKKEAILWTSADMALLCFSVELYFSMKWRYSDEKKSDQLSDCDERFMQ